MRHRPFVLLTALVFAMVSCSGSDDDDATTADTQTTDTEAVTGTVATTPPTEATTAFENNTTTPTTSDGPTGQVEAFSFAADDLCEWVTQEEIAGFIAAAFDWDGTLVEQPTQGPDNSAWELVGNGSGGVSVYDAGQWETFGGNPVDWGAEDIVEFSDDDPDYVEIGATVSGHPALSDGVVVHNGAFGQYAFWVPPRPEYLAFSLDVPGVDNMFEADRFFMVADQIIRELGWVD